MLEYVNPKNIAILFLCIMVLIWVDPLKVANAYFYLKNGSTLDIPNYTLKFKFGHWANVNDEGKYFHLQSYKDGINLEISKHPKSENIQAVLQDCTDITKEVLKYKDITLNSYLCQTLNENYLYFQSKDFFAYTRFNRKFTKKNKNIYAQLFNNIRRR